MNLLVNMHELVLPEKNLSKDRRSQQKDLQKYKMCHQCRFRAELCDPPCDGVVTSKLQSWGVHVLPKWGPSRRRTCPESSLVACASSGAAGARQSQMDVGSRPEAEDISNVRI